MRSIYISVCLLALFGCSGPVTKLPEAALPSAGAFTAVVEGRPIGLFVLSNKNDMQAAITNYGARLVSLIVPATGGNRVDVVAGFDSLKGYTAKTNYYGATIGRYANRIADGVFSLGGTEYHLPLNDGPNSLHGGAKGFDAQPWSAVPHGDSALDLYYVSRDAEQGYPGNLVVTVTYTLTSDNALRVSYTAMTDSPTVINLTNHSFFNLNGQGSGAIDKHLLQIFGDLYTPIDSALIPTGETLSVAGTPFDFREPQPIGARTHNKDPQLAAGHGYDHNFVLTGKKDSGGMRLAARATGDQSGVVMEIFTTEPGLQFYGGNFMDGKSLLKGGVPDRFRTAFCLETQHFPDSPNEPDWPSTALYPGESFRSTTLYRFSVAP